MKEMKAHDIRNTETCNIYEKVYEVIREALCGWGIEVQGGVEFVNYIEGVIRLADRLLGKPPAKNTLGMGFVPPDEAEMIKLLRNLEELGEY